MRVLVCGSRDFDDRATMLWFAGCFRNGDVLIVGGAPGADTMARDMVRSLGYQVSIEEFPADWKKHGRAAGPIRNRQMLDEGKPDVVVAFSTLPNALTRGTANMVAQAKAAGVPTYVLRRA